jgi:hypothetical protein
LVFESYCTETRQPPVTSTAPEKDGKPPDPGKPPEQAKLKVTRNRLLAKLRKQQDEKDSGHVTRTVQQTKQTPVDRTKQTTTRLKKCGAPADFAPADSGEKQAKLYPSEDNRNTWQETNGRPTSANLLLASADENIASLEAKLKRSEIKTFRIATELADMQAQKNVTRTASRKRSYTFKSPTRALQKKWRRSKL